MEPTGFERMEGIIKEIGFGNVNMVSNRSTGDWRLVNFNCEIVDLADLWTPNNYELSSFLYLTFVYLVHLPGNARRSV